MHRFDSKYDLKGAHLSAPGPYLEAIKRLLNKNPDLRFDDLEDFERTAPGVVNPRSKVVVLHLYPGRNAVREDITSLEELRNYLKRQGDLQDNSKRHTLLMVEGFHPEFVAVIGQHFGIDPKLFAKHHRNATFDTWHASGNTPSLASTGDDETTFVLQYWELWYSVAGTRTGSLRCGDSRRDIGTCRVPGQHFNKVGRKRSKVGFWSREYKAGYWDSVLLLDPPLKCVVSRCNTAVNKVDAEPYQGGYKDFITYATLSDACATPGPSRKSMLEDISYYWTTYGHRIQDLSKPITATFFMQKIVASQYMLYISYFLSIIGYLDWALTWQTDLANIKREWIEQRWSDLKSWSRQFIEAADVLKRFVTLLETIKPVPLEMMDCLRDFRDVHLRIVELKSRADSSSSSITCLASIVHNRHTRLDMRRSITETRRSIHEAKSLKTLSWLAIIFVPPSFVCSIFSMQDLYIPGSGKFWIFLATALPLVAMVVAVILVVNTGYSQDGGWSWAKFKNICAGNDKVDHETAVWAFNEELQLPHLFRAPYKTATLTFN